MDVSKSLIYDLSDFSECVELSRFQYALCAYSGTVLAIATEGSLILTNDSSSGSSNGAYYGEDYSTARLILEFNEDSGRPSCIQWIIEGEVVAVGFDSGLVVCFNCKGEEIWAFKGATSPVQSIKVAVTAVHKMGAAIWLLHEEGLLISLPVGHVLDGNMQNMAVYRLTSNKQLNDFVFYPQVYRTSVFDTDEVALLPTQHSGLPNTATTGTGGSAKKAKATTGAVSTPNALLSVFAAGLESSLAVYNLGGVVFASEAERSAASVRESAVNLLSKSVMSLYSWYGGGNAAGTGTGDGTAAGEKKTDQQRVQESTLVVAAKVQFLDTKRRVLKLSADPGGVYIAAADSLGRVTLYDTQVGAVVRIWKGLRHAELAWTSRRLAQPAPGGGTQSGNTSANASTNTSAAALDTIVPTYGTHSVLQPTSGSGLTDIHYRPYAINLVIHAPLLGLVYIYPMPHGPCARIIPVGLNCHIFSLTVPGDGHVGMGSNSSDHYGGEGFAPSQEVRSYLLKPLPDKCSVEVSEIQPAELAATDLDVRLTLVGTDSADVDADYYVGEGDDTAYTDDDSPTATGAGSRRDLFSDNHLGSRRPSSGVPRIMNPAGSARATESNAMWNIEQSLQLLVEALPLSALRHAWTASSSGVSASGGPITGSNTGAGAGGLGGRVPFIPASRDLFDIAVERAEESILELLKTHKGVLGMNALYKCLCMIESVELFGELTPPLYAQGGNSASVDDATVGLLSYAVALYGQAVATGAIRYVNGGRLIRGNSSASLLSLASEGSAVTSAVGSTAAAGGNNGSHSAVQAHRGAKPSANDAMTPPLSLLLGWMRLPAFSAHLHKTLLTMLSEAIAAHEQAGRHKYQYDVSKGEVTHLPAHILKHLKTELPVRLRCLAAYTTFQELGTAAERARTESVRQHGAFNPLQSVNIRQLFDRSAPSTAPGVSAGGPTGSGGLSQYSLLGGMSPLSTTVTTAPHSPAPSVAPAHHSTSNRATAGGGDGPARHSVDDEVAALCKLNTHRTEAAMWALRAAQNAAQQAAREAALAHAATLAAATTAVVGPSGQRSASMETFGADRLASADSGGSFNSVSRTAAQLLGTIGVRQGLLTPTDSAENIRGGDGAGLTAGYTSANTNSHSKVRRVGGKDVPTTPTSDPSLGFSVEEAGQSPQEAAPFPSFPTVYAKRSDSTRGRFVTPRGAADVAPGRSHALNRHRSRSPSPSSGSDSRLAGDTLQDQTTEMVSFSAFRAVHLAYGTAQDCRLRDPSADVICDELVRFYPESDAGHHEKRERDACFRTSDFAMYVLRTEYAPNGLPWSQLHSGGPYGDPTAVGSGQAPGSAALGELRHHHSAGSGLSSPAEPSTPRQANAAQKASMTHGSVPSGTGGVDAEANAHASMAAKVTARLLQLPSLCIETVVSTTTKSGTGSPEVAGKGSAASSALFTLTWAPTYTIPHTLLNFLIAPLAGDIFSLTAYHEALRTMGIANKFIALKHVAPLFFAHLARQPTEHLITEVLIKKLSTFPFQRWLRDSLLTFQDTLTALESAQSRSGTDSGKSAAPDRDAGVKHAGAGESGESDTHHSEEDSAWVQKLASEVRELPSSSTNQGDTSVVAEALQGSHDGAALPSYDDFIRHILRPAWLYGHQCTNLEAVMTFAAFVLETLTIVNDQVERRTYGKHSVRGTIQAWEGILRQTRLVLLLRSRAGDASVRSKPTSDGIFTDPVRVRRSTEFTIANLSRGRISLHRLLAQDTLGFAVRAEQALEHEEKCREVYARSSQSRRLSTQSTSTDGQSTKTMSTAATATKSEVLLAWGQVADRRWKDLLAVAVAEDAIQTALQSEVHSLSAISGSQTVPGGKAATTQATAQSPLASMPSVFASLTSGTTAPASANATAAEQARRAEEQKRTLKRRRPLLLYFPLHSQPHLLGAYRTIILAERWSRAIHRVDLLVCASQHLFSLPPATWRAAVAAHIYMTHIFPVVEVFVALEEDAQLMALASAGGKISAWDHPTMQRTKLPAQHIQQLLKLIGDMRLLKSFINTAAEVLGFIESSLHGLQPHIISGSAGGSSRSGTGAAVKGVTSVASLWEHVDVRDARYASLQLRRRASVDDELPHASWPAQEDAYLNEVLIKYAGDVSGSPKTSAGGAIAGVTSANKVEPAVLWSPLAVAGQIVMLWVMHLRSLCSLRGVKPSEVLGEALQMRLRALSDAYDVTLPAAVRGDEVGDLTAAGAQSGSSQAKATPPVPVPPPACATPPAVQHEFLTQCLRQLVLARQPAGAVYILAMRWISMATASSSSSSSKVVKDSTPASTAAPLTMDAVRLQHLRILLAAGGGSRDEEAEQMVSQISNTDVVLDTLIEALRRRMGLILSRIDQLPSFGPLIAAMDAEAVAWARGAATGAVALQTQELSALDYDGGTPGTAEGESDLAGICRSLNINIASTRHLVICVQSNLLNVPANMRRAPSSATEEMPALSSGYGAGASSTTTTWFQRKTRCDALLALCKYFAQQFTASKH